MQRLRLKLVPTKFVVYWRAMMRLEALSRGSMRDLTYPKKAAQVLWGILKWISGALAWTAKHSALVVAQIAAALVLLSFSYGIKQR